jgi:erythromycin esterase
MKKILLIILLFAGFITVFSMVYLMSQTEKETTEITLVEYLAKKAIDLNNGDDLNMLIEKASDKKLVLLGEASHGTHEYYKWRGKISKRLIKEKGFNFILVEGDFAFLYELNRYVKGMESEAASALEVLNKADRWPQWMWGNHETAQLAQWLKDYNKDLPPGKKVGFYGMDVYDEWRSKRAVINSLRGEFPKLYEKIKELYSCFFAYEDDSWEYAAAVRNGAEDCSKESQKAVEAIYANRSSLSGISDYDYFYLLQNSYVVKHAEKFYRKSAAGRRGDSWNARARHMHNSAIRLLELYGSKSKGIVWAHNTHIGDASFTDMKNFDQVNIGQLSREHFGEDNVFLVGFTTYKGEVQAGRNWGSQREVMTIPEAQNNSIEELLNRTGISSFYLIFDSKDREHEEMMKPMGNRAVGVVYNPMADHRQYVPTIIPMRYDALVFFKETKALDPINL